MWAGSVILMSKAVSTFSASILSPLDLTWQFSSPGCSKKTGEVVEEKRGRGMKCVCACVCGGGDGRYWGDCSNALDMREMPGEKKTGVNLYSRIRTKEKA